MSKSNRVWKISNDVVVETYGSLINVHDLSEKIDIDLHWSEAEKLIPALKEAIVEVKRGTVFEEKPKLNSLESIMLLESQHINNRLNKQKDRLKHMNEIMLDSLSKL